MKSVFLVFQELKSSHGISKKIISQFSSLEKVGLDIELCSIKTIRGSKYYVINNIPIQCNGNGVASRIKYYTKFSGIIDYIIKNGVKFLYIRYIHNANFFFLAFLRHLKKNGVYIILEIPTYPYDLEYENVRLIKKIQVCIERYSRRELSKYIDNIVTFSSDKKIFNVPTINISNAVDFNSITLKKDKKNTNEFVFIGVANLANWHGYDRLIAGIHKYYKVKMDSVNINFYIIGSGNKEVYSFYQHLISKYKLENNVYLVGPKSGAELDAFFNIADIAVGCLGCHRKGITEVKSLKNVEYAARGIPFLYSEQNNDFDDKPYVIKVPADESPINIQEVIRKIKSCKLPPIEIRKDVSRRLSWDMQMKRVFDKCFTD